MDELSRYDRNGTNQLFITATTASNVERQHHFLGFILSKRKKMGKNYYKGNKMVLAKVIEHLLVGKNPEFGRKAAYFKIRKTRI